MWKRLAALGVAALAAAPASADVADYLEKPIAVVSVESQGRALTEPRFGELIETHVGEPLRIAAVRQSVIHLFSLGEFEDVRVHATASGAGVALRYELVPMQAIGSIIFSGPGASDVDRGRLRELVVERFGVAPRPSRVVEIGAVITDELRQLGYLRAVVTPRVDVAGDRLHERLVVDIEPGERARIGSIQVEGDPGISEAELLRIMRISSGSPFQRSVINEGVDRYVAGRVRLGFLAARASYAVTFVDADRTANLSLSVSSGQHVTVVFAGDPLPADRRAELVPIEREGSVDEDLLEDASLAIETYLRTEGHRDASVTHTRQEAGGELTITFTIRRGPLYRVSRVDFAGNTSIPLTDLQARTRIRPGQAFTETALEADVNVIEDLYRAAGFAAVRTEDALDSEEPVFPGGEVPVAIRITITEGPKTIVSSARIDAAPGLGLAEVSSSLGLRPGRPYSQIQLGADRDVIQLRLANLGYQNAVVTATPGFSADGRAADVVFAVREGPRIFVDHVLIVGNERTRTETIARELQFKAGQPLGLEQVNESQRRLAALGLFRRVRITELQHGDATRRDVLVSLEEAPVATIGYGGGLEGGQRLRTEDATGVATEQLVFAPRAFFEIGRRNLFGKNRSVNLFTRVSLRPREEGAQPIQTAGEGVAFSEYRIFTQYREPGVLGTSADFRVTGALEQQSRASFDFARRSASAELASRLSRTVSLSGGYQIQRSTLLAQRGNLEEQKSIDRILPRVRLSFVSTSLVRDTRNDPLDTSAGRYLSATGQLAARAIGSRIGFFKSFFTAQTFHHIASPRSMVVALSGRLGMVTTFAAPNLPEDEQTLPGSERFFAGGDTTVRGFAFDQLGVRHHRFDETTDTVDSSNYPSGGSGLVVLNGELRVPLRGSFGVVGFLDSGNVFKYARQIDLAQLRTAAGFGVRYKSPIGPIRVDLGFKLGRQTWLIECETGLCEQRETPTAIHISLGQAF